MLFRSQITILATKYINDSRKRPIVLLQDLKANGIIEDIVVGASLDVPHSWITYGISYMSYDNLYTQEDIKQLAQLCKDSYSKIYEAQDIANSKHNPFVDKDPSKYMQLNYMLSSKFNKVDILRLNIPINALVFFSKEVPSAQGSFR